MEYNFSINFKLGAVNPENVKEAFKERIENYYFKPIKMLNERKFGFAATTLLASLIDIFAKTENHDTTNKNNRFKYISWLKNNFKFEPELAKFFYEKIRCGLLHAGCIESGGQISYKQEEIFRHDKEQIIINPNPLFENLERIFSNFIEKEDSEELYNYLKLRVSEIN